MTFPPALLGNSEHEGTQVVQDGGDIGIKKRTDRSRSFLKNVFLGSNYGNRCHRSVTPTGILNIAFCCT